MATPALDPAALLAPGSPTRVATIREAADGGMAEAQAVYAQMLLDGHEVPRDAAAAFALFNKAAAQGHLMALNMVGRCYDLGQGTRVDKARAAECFRVAAERGLDWAMYNYATALTLGEGVAQDRSAALTWLEKAAAMGNAKAMNFVGSFREDGWACERDMAAAAACYARAAEGGDFRGAFNHARMLGAAGDVDAALHWLTRAGASGTPAFVANVAAWLEACDIPALRTRGPAALKGPTSC